MIEKILEEGTIFSKIKVGGFTKKMALDCSIFLELRGLSRFFFRFLLMGLKKNSAKIHFGICQMLKNFPIGYPNFQALWCFVVWESLQSSNYV